MGENKETCRDEKRRKRTPEVMEIVGMSGITGHIPALGGTIVLELINASP